LAMIDRLLSSVSLRPSKKQKAFRVLIVTTLAHPPTIATDGRQGEQLLHLCLTGAPSQLSYTILAHAVTTCPALPAGRAGSFPGV
jgi:hypothetical protein